MIQCSPRKSSFPGSLRGGGGCDRPIWWGLGGPRGPRDARRPWPPPPRDRRPPFPYTDPAVRFRCPLASLRVPPTPCPRASFPRPLPRPRASLSCLPLRVAPWCPSQVSEGPPPHASESLRPACHPLPRTKNEAAMATFEFYFPWFESARPLEIIPAQGPSWRAGPQAWGRRRRHPGRGRGGQFGRPRRRVGQAGRVAGANARSRGRRTGI